MRPQSLLFLAFSIIVTAAPLSTSGPLTARSKATGVTVDRSQDGSTHITGFNPTVDFKDSLDRTELDLSAGGSDQAADPNLTRLLNNKRQSSTIDFDSDVLLKIDIDNDGSDPTRVGVGSNVLLDGRRPGRGKTHVIVEGDVFVIPARHPV
ncbi:hypothetical protein TWF225_006052 [Orbilia oligospora]|uniref:Uncharacterized protein n=1 Tax=Orbilia oligospora TaxID=2813651 RepID=A0A7C8KI33_ORBOL|nr:hypothetical protein TWF751_004850 [Orbilia oligospora]KAF3184380.1 hypothetical protein TWF225_006052 [Orbilia oligospora]KAF3233460.1 hypothetical protein TWF128_002993 [Orbilia oligospora]KAF3257779.1 hypothetical protein TWF217_005887 [Orbilia oligospora]KAF3283999.1 hypothetical protein TWF132_009892 [Orbilia oligospora]